MNSPISIGFDIDTNFNLKRYIKYDKLRNTLNNLDEFTGQNRIYRPPVFAWP